MSNLGNVRSKNRRIVRIDGVIHNRVGKIKAQTETPDGYLSVNLSKDGNDRRYAVHILVAKEFVAGFISGYEVNHKDCNRKNNRADNLEWMSHCDNIAYTISSNRHITQIRDMKMENNPNFGNHSLKKKYALNPDLAKEKQSRPGKNNGRAKSVIMTGTDGVTVEFPYMEDCARYLIAHGIPRGKNINSVATYVSRAAKENKPYYGYMFSFK